MAESKATAPHFYLQAEIDMSRGGRGARTQLKADGRRGTSSCPTFNDMVVKACALALREFPRANGAYRDGRIELYSRVNVGVAVAAQDALVVPTIFDADLKGLRQIAAETRALAAQGAGRDRSPRPSSRAAPSRSRTSGCTGSPTSTAVINPPQAGILAVGASQGEAGGPTTARSPPRHLMGVTLACDHRILYGADGALFLARVRELLEEPLGLAL